MDREVAERVGRAIGAESLTGGVGASGDEVDLNIIRKCGQYYKENATRLMNFTWLVKVFPVPQSVNSVDMDIAVTCGGV